MQERDGIYMPADRPPVSKWIPLSIQHVFAMFGATVLVPILTGLSVTSALFTAGTGTLIYILITGAKVPAFLGSSFAFIPAIIGIAATYGVPYAMGGAVAAGIFYGIIATIIRASGLTWVKKALPPVVIGSVIIVIGLSLAPTAIDMAMNDASGNYSLVYLSMAVVTLAATVVANIFLKGFFSIIPILIGLVFGYLFTLVMGFVFPLYALIDFSGVQEAAWMGLPQFQVPKFNVVAMVTFIIVSLATMAEHLGDTVTLGNVVGKDFTQNPGLHRTLAGDGVATAWAAFWGGPPNTTYGENIGVMAITRVYSVWVIGGAAVVATILSFFPKVGALIQTIPTPVIGGISMLLFGIIASSGMRNLVESGVDYKDKRNLIISSVILVIGIGGGLVAFPIGGGLEFQMGGVALATLIGIVLNLVIPKTVP
jgi:uracil permease